MISGSMELEATAGGGGTRGPTRLVGPSFFMAVALSIVMGLQGARTFHLAHVVRMVAAVVGGGSERPGAAAASAVGAAGAAELVKTEAGNIHSCVINRPNRQGGAWQLRLLGL
jgi:hypothetical protein